jgi:hypothetical protein
MDKSIVVPLALFFSVVYALKLLVDARMRYLYWKGGSSPETVAAMFAGEERLRRLGALRWGVVAFTLGAVLLLADTTGLKLFSAGGLAVLLVALGLGNIAAFACTEYLARRAAG